LRGASIASKARRYERGGNDGGAAGGGHGDADGGGGGGGGRCGSPAGTAGGSDGGGGEGGAEGVGGDGGAEGGGAGEADGGGDGDTDGGGEGETDGGGTIGGSGARHLTSTEPMVAAFVTPTSSSYTSTQLRLRMVHSSSRGVHSSTVSSASPIPIEFPAGGDGG